MAWPPWIFFCLGSLSLSSVPPDLFVPSDPFWILLRMAAFSTSFRLDIEDEGLNFNGDGDVVEEVLKGRAVPP